MKATKGGVSKNFQHVIVAVRKHMPAHRTLLPVSVLLFAAIGTILLISSHAATPTANFEAEAGTRSGNASLVSDSGASGGSAVKFGGTGSACTVSTRNTSDGPDPWGGCFPGTSNTGVPAGTTLTPYTGDCTITANNVVIDSKIMNCDPRLAGANLTIKNSKVMGSVTQTYQNSGAITIINSDIDNGNADVQVITASNVTILGSNIHGGESSLNCQGNCTVKNSFFHGQYNNPAMTSHLGGFLSNGTAHFDIEHNTIQCDAAPIGAGGCSGDFNMFGDFGQIDDAYIYNNLFPSVNNYPSYCLYMGSFSGVDYPHATNIRFINNVVGKGPNGKCGQFGPYAGWEGGNTGNVWSGNQWDDGTPLN